MTEEQRHGVGIDAPLHGVGIDAPLHGVGIDAPLHGVGIDAVDIPRFREVMTRRPGVLERVFTERERSYAGEAHDPAPRFAARFAAKEAVLKALGVGLGACALNEIEVLRAEDGRPSIDLAGRARHLAKSKGVERLHVSLTHTDVVAMAMALAEARRGPVPNPSAADPERAKR